MDHYLSRYLTLLCRTSIYLVLVLLGIIPIFTGDDPLSGIFAILLTQPWRAWLVNLLPSSPSLLVGVFSVAVGAAINALILYSILRWLVGRFAK